MYVRVGRKSGLCRLAGKVLNVKGLAVVLITERLGKYDGYGGLAGCKCVAIPADVRFCLKIMGAGPNVPVFPRMRRSTRRKLMATRRTFSHTGRFGSVLILHP